ncbi:MAG: peptidoglycan-binding domain-containing protein [Bryocella sp.]
MQIIRKILPATLLMLVVPCWASTTTHKHKAHTTTTKAHTTAHTTTVASHHRSTASHGHKTKTAGVPHPAVAMATERATAIQQALIRTGYMSGEPSGVWDAQSAAAMQKMQGANGWQTKITPDSRALIKLGLGPQTDTASNGETSNGGGI